MRRECERCHFLAERVTQYSFRHLISNPVLGIDVIRDNRHYVRRRKIFRLGMDPPYEFRCKKCPEFPIYKLWEMQSLTQHLLSKWDFLCEIIGQYWRDFCLGIEFWIPVKEKTGLKLMSLLPYHHPSPQVTPNSSLIPNLHQKRRLDTLLMLGQYSAVVCCYFAYGYVACKPYIPTTLHLYQQGGNKYNVLLWTYTDML